MDGRAARVGGAVVRGWRAFGRWRWSRPFWGGLLLILAGAELFATTQGGGDINGLAVHVGPSGYLSWLIPAVLVTCGVLVWFSPAQRVFYAVIGAVTSVFSLMAVNLGGFFIGLLLGAVGSVLAFGWTPAVSVTEAEPVGEETGQEAGGEIGEEAGSPKAEGDGGPGSSTVEIHDHKLRRGYDESGASGPGARRTPMAVWILIFVVMAGIGLLPGADAAHAQPCPSPSPSATPSPSASPGRSPGPLEEIIDGITGGIGDLLGIGGPDTSPTPTSPVPSAPASTPAPGGSCGGDPADPSDPAGPGDPGGPRPGPSESGRPGTSPGPGKDPASQVKQLGIPAGVPPVAMRPSILTGSKVEMWNLGLDGIVDMPRADGSTIKALQFSMTKAYTHDFKLDTPRHQELSPITSSRLDVEGDVKFYATKFTGALLGIPITLTPESPIPPDGIPIALPYIAFDSPSMELLLATCDVLTGPDLVDQV